MIYLPHIVLKSLLLVILLNAVSGSTAQRSLSESESSRTTLSQSDERASNLVCYTQAVATRVMGNANSTVAFASRTTLDVVVTFDESVARTISTEMIAKNIAKAMVLWRSSCEHCIAGNVSVLLVNGTRFMDSGLARYLRTADLNNISHAPRPITQADLDAWSKTPAHFKVDTPPASSERAAQPASPNRESGTAGPSPQQAQYPYDVLVSMLNPHQTPTAALINYESFSTSDKGYLNICSADKSKLPAMLEDVRTALHCPQDSSNIESKTARLSMYVLDGSTSCGRNVNIIGCSADNLVVELDAHDYQFVSHETGEALFGSPTGLQVDFLHVILHEFGHWLGLPHLSSPGSIMADSLSTSKCIDDKTVSVLDSHVQDQVERLKGKGAFYYRPSAR